MTNKFLNSSDGSYTTLVVYGGADVDTRHVNGDSAGAVYNVTSKTYKNR